MDASIEKSPAPLASESAVITVAPAVVRFSLKEMSPVEVSVNAPVPEISPDVVDIVRSPPAVNVTPAPKSIPVAPVRVKAPALVIDVESRSSFPVSVAIVKPLPKLVLLPPFAVNALKVESLLEKLTLEALAVVKLTVVALLLFAADIPSTVILPVELSPIFKVPAVIFPSSVPVIVIFPDVPPKPIVPPSDTAIVVEPVPLEIVPAISTSSASIVMLALSSVVRALPEAMVNVPVPLSSESGLKVTDDAIVRSPLTVIPFPAFTVTCLIVEAVVPNSTDPLEPLEFNVTPPEICERVTPST